MAKGNAIELATAYVKIVPSLRGASKQISSELGGVDTGPIGRKMGSSLSASMARALDFGSVEANLRKVGESVSSIGERLTSKLTKPALAAATAIGGIFVARGAARLVGIDDARASLVALGHDAQAVETIMESALASVKGTSFGLEEAATVAATAVAAGIEPGERLTGYLGTVADAAAIARTSMDEMGSIFNKVQTGTVAYTEDLERLADRGLPIYQWLGDELGISAGEVKEWASSGEISSETFFSAVERNVGGAAKTIGELSVSAAWANTLAAAGRVGAALLDAGGDGNGAFSQLKGILGDVTGILDGMQAKAEEVGARLGSAVSVVADAVGRAAEGGFDPSGAISLAGLLVGLGPTLAASGSALGALAPVAQEMSSAFGAAEGRLSSFVGSVTEGGGAASRLTSALGSLKTGAAGTLGTVRQKALGAYASFQMISGLGERFGVSDALRVLVPDAEGARAASASLRSGLAGLASSALDLAVGGFGRAASGALGLMSALGTASLALTAVGAVVAAVALGASMAGLDFASFGESVSGALEGGGEVVASFLREATAAVPAAVEGVRAAGPAIVQSLIGAMSQVGVAGAQLLPAFTQLVVTIVPMLAQLLAQAAPMLLSGALQLFGALVTAMAQSVPLIAAQVPTLVQGVVTAIVANAPSILSAGVHLFQELANAIPQVVPSLVAAIPQIAQCVASTLPTLVPQVLAAAVTLFTAIVQAIPQVLPAVISAVGTLVGSVASNLPGYAGQVLAAAVTMFMAVATAVGEVVGSVLDAIGDMLSQAWDAITSFDLSAAGAQFIQGFIGGIQSMAGSLADSALGVVRGAVDGVKGFLGIASPSRLMHGIGEYVDEGLANGIDDLADEPARAISRVGERVAREAWAYGYHAAVDYSEGLGSATATVAQSATGVGAAATDALSDADAEMAAYVEKMIAGYRERGEEAVEVSTELADAIWGAWYPKVDAVEWVRPVTGAVYESMKALEAAGYDLDSYKAKLREVAETAADWERRSTKGLSDSEKESYADWLEEVAAFEEVKSSLSASISDMERWQGLYSIKDELITTTGGAERLSSAIAGVNVEGVRFSAEFVEAIAEGGEDVCSALESMAELGPEAIQQLSDSYADAARAEREAELNARSLYVNSLRYTDLSSQADQMLDFRETVLDVREAIYSDAGLSAAFERLGASAEGFALDLSSMEVSMDDFLGSLDGFVSSVSDGFSQMTKHGKTGLDEWSQNLRLNMAEAQSWSTNLQEVFAKVPESIDSEAFRQAVMEGGFDQWGQVIADMAGRSSEEIASLIELYNDSLEEARLSGIEAFRALSPGEEMVQSVIDGMAAQQGALDEAMTEAGESSVSALADMMPQFVSTGSSLAAGIASGISSQVGSIAAAAASTVRAAIQAAKDEAAIASPSKVADREVGSMIGLGVARGILSMSGAASDAMSSVVGGAVASGRSSLSSVRSAAQRPVSSGGDTYYGGDIHVSATVRSDEDVRRLAREISRLQSRQMRAEAYA